ncbi:unnamed protein product [Protopolystoma xenopodis]|uniref:Uncharacterized protein n=1 Tax=Protopolystoma xenopodis TaxID=117903 RepID=A0A3S5A1H1_9PLAT|nr:unnamed protein product [Protopolystoma xenopodis]
MPFPCDVSELDIVYYYEFPSGPELAPSSDTLVSLFARICANPDRIEFSEFEAYYEAVCIALGDSESDEPQPPADTNAQIDKYSGLRETASAPRIHSRLVGLIRTAWAV